MARDGRGGMGEYLRCPGQAAWHETFLLPFLGEQFSIRNIIYEPEE